MQETIELWRERADSDNPAGPLFVGGEFAEADIVGGGDNLVTQICGTICTNHCVCC
jgi:hypothetical protein